MTTMILTEENIRKIVEGVPVGSFGPFLKHDTKECNAYAKKLCKKIESIKSLEVELMDDSYGSGYASYYDLFLTKRDKSVYSDKGGYTLIKGVTLYISRLAPVSVFGYGERTRNRSGSSYGFLDASSIGTLPDGDWSRELSKIKETINIYKYSLLSKSEVSKELWFNVAIPTILDSKNIFDSLFYWAD